MHDAAARGVTFRALVSATSDREALSENAVRCGLRSATGPPRQSGRGARDLVLAGCPFVVP